MPARPDPEQIEAALLGGDARYTRAEAVQKSGAGVEFADRVWRALGFATRSQDAAAFTESDVAALATAQHLLTEGILDEDAYNAPRTDVYADESEEPSPVAA